ncbi:MAG: iron uptake protein [Panacagrimonas sp.]
MSSHTLPAHLIVSRIAASVLGGYAFVWGIATLSLALMVTAGMPYGEAQTLVMLLAFLVFLWAFCWAFAAANLRRVWAVLLGGGAAMSALAWWLASMLA